MELNLDMAEIEMGDSTFEAHLGIEREIGSLTARMNNVETVIGEVRSDVKTLVNLAEQMKGSKKTLLGVAGLGGVFGSIATKFGIFAGLFSR